MQLKEASILLVDDEPLLLDIMREWFESIVAQLFCAGDGVRALQVLGKHRIDLIVTDVRMPVMDGIALLKRIEERGRSTPSLILITGFADIELRDAYDLGAGALLEKPVEWDDLIDTVRRNLLEPRERWARQPEISPSHALSRRFKSLSSALQEHRIAFGRGGFCIEKSEFPEGEPVNLALDFMADEYVLLGQGVVRWSQENQMGVELTYVADESLARAVQITEPARTFIPRTTERSYQALAG